MSTTARTDRLIQILNSGQKYSYKELQRHLGLRSTRQIQRLFASLEDAGIQIVEEFDGHKKLFGIRGRDQKHRVQIIELREEQMLALAVAAQAARSVLAPTPLSPPLQTAFESLLDRLDSQPVSFDLEAQSRQWHFNEAPSVPLKPEIFDTLRQAISDRQSVLIDYYSASSNRHSASRKVDPYCMAARNGSWLLVAYCHERRAMREFNIVDISQAVPCDPNVDRSAIFTLPDDFDLDIYFRDRFSSLAGGEVQEVRLLVEQKQAQYFRRKEYHPTQQIEEEREDGRIVVSYEVAGLEEIRSFVQSWGTGVTVLDPVELEETIRKQAEELADRYERGRR